MNKEQQELSEPTMETELPPLETFLEAEYVAVFEAMYARRKPWRSQHLHRSRNFSFLVERWVLDLQKELLASLERERELQATNNALTRVCAAQISKIAESESQLLAKDALIASLNAEILKQNKAEDELLATGEKLAEERK